MPAPGQRIHRRARGASASCTKNSFSAGHLGDAGASSSTASVWKLSTISPSARMVRRLHDAPGVTPSVDMTPPGQRLVSDAQPARAARARPSPPGRRRRGRRRRARRHAMLLHTSTRSVPSACITSNLRSARSMLRVRCGSGIASKSRNGWKIVIARPRPFGDAPHVRGRSVEGQQIVLEHFDAVEADGGGGIQLFRQRAAQGDCGDGLRMAC